jgi:hypothetical protein
MPVQVTVCDQKIPGQTLHEFVVNLLTERVTARELIRSRVHQEVEDFNLKQPEVYRGLVQPTDTEVTLNGFKLKKRRQLDWKEAFDKAVQAFEANRVLLLVDDAQAQTLEQEFVVTPKSRVTFLRLTPLVGG